MKIMIDTELEVLSTEIVDGDRAEYPLYSPEAYDVVVQQYQNLGWHLKASYGFTWLGTPIVQLPDDMLRLQELIIELQPEVIIETGVSRGGSMLFYASLCHLMALSGHVCRVIGIDHNIWPETREHLEQHPLFQYITLVDGDSKDSAVVKRVQSLVETNECTLVTLDSAHDKDHVLAELEAYAPLVSEGSYMIVQDGLMAHVTEGPRSRDDWDWNTPEHAALEFLTNHPEFIDSPPERLFNQSRVVRYPTQWPVGWLRRIPLPPVPSFYSS